VAEEAHVGTEVVVAHEAVLAPTTGVGRLDDDALALAGTGHDHASELVAQHERLVDDRLADTAVLVPVEVGAAQADRGDTYELLAGRGDGLGFLVDTDVFRAVQTKHFHVMKIARRRGRGGLPERPPLRSAWKGV
jgi:hypothetical protein